MGWEDIKVAVEYDGDQHRAIRYQYVKDIRRFEMLERYGWIVVRVIAEDHPDHIIRRSPRPSPPGVTLGREVERNFAPALRARGRPSATRAVVG
jgi:hypothetical protein